MIVVWVVAALSGVGFFVLLWPYGWIVALIGASLLGSTLTALAAFALAAWRSRRSTAARPARREGSGVPRINPARSDAGPSQF